MRNQEELYLLDVLRRRLEYPELKRAVREQYERFRPSVVLIEDKASATQLIQELTREGLYAVTRYKPQSDKVMRMHAQTAMIENGFVRVPEKAPWLAQYLNEMTVFPNGRHDDQVDSTAQMLDWFKDGGLPSTNAGIFELTPAARRGAAPRTDARSPSAPARPARHLAIPAARRANSVRGRRRHGRADRSRGRAAAERGVGEGGG